MKEERITRVTRQGLSEDQGKTDWDRVPKGEPDHDPEFDDADWDWDNAVALEGVFAQTVLPEPTHKKAISLRVDADILDFFKSEGKGYQTRMNAVLRAYMNARKAG